MGRFCRSGQGRRHLDFHIEGWEREPERQVLLGIRGLVTCQLKNAKFSILSLAVRDHPSAAGDPQFLQLIPQIDRRRTDRHHFAVVVAPEHVIEYRPRIVFAVIGLCQKGIIDRALTG